MMETKLTPGRYMGDCTAIASSDEAIALAQGSRALVYSHRTLELIGETEPLGKGGGDRVHVLACTARLVLAAGGRWARLAEVVEPTSAAGLRPRWSAGPFRAWVLTAKLLSQGAAFGLADNSVEVWDEGGMMARSECQERGLLFAMGLGTEGTTSTMLAVSGTARRGLLVWRPFKQVEPTFLQGHDGAIFGIRVHAPMGVVATAGEDRFVCLWRLSTGEKLLSLYGHGSRAWTCSLSERRDGQLWLAEAGEDGSARLWQLSSALDSAKIALSVQAHFGRGTWDCCFLGNGDRLATAGADGSARMWRLPDEEEDSEEAFVSRDVPGKAPSGKARALSFSIESGKLYIATRQGEVVEPGQGVILESFGNILALDVQRESEGAFLALQRGALATVSFPDGGVLWRCESGFTPDQMYAAKRCRFATWRGALALGRNGSAFFAPEGSQGGRVLRTGRGKAVVAGDVSDDGTKLCAALADQGGAIFAFRFCLHQSEGCDVEPLSVVDKAHGIHAPCMISLTPEFISGGKDGCICSYDMSDANGLRLTGKERVRSLSAVLEVHHSSDDGSCERSAVSGFAKKEAAIVDPSSGGSMAKVRSNGHYAPAAFLPPSSSWASAVASISGNGVALRRGNECIATLNARRFHGYIITCCACAPGAVITGSEDGTLFSTPISCTLSPNVPTSFAQHGAGAKVADMRLFDAGPSTKALLTVGAKGVIMCWRVDWRSERLVATKVLAAKSPAAHTSHLMTEADMRHTCVAAASVGRSGFAVVAGRGDGLVSMHWADFSSGEVRREEQLSHHRCPLLCTDALDMPDGSSLLMTAGTDGEVALWRHELHTGCALIARMPGLHQAGVNSARLFRVGGEGWRFGLISGGDDQRLCVKECRVSGERVEVLWSGSEDMAHASAIKGVEAVIMQGVPVVVTAGLDQRVRLWRWSGDCQLLATRVSHVANLEALCASSLSSNSASLVICGRGLECFSISM